MFKPLAAKTNDQSRDCVVQILRENELSTATAFVDAVFTDVKASGANFTDSAAILRAAKRQQVPPDPSIERTWNAGFARKPHLNTSASRDIIRDYLRQKRLPFTASMIDAALQLIDNKRLAPTPEHAQQERAADHRRRLIATIESGHKTYPLWSTVHGQFRYLAVEELENETNEMLEALAQRVPEWREQLTGSHRPEPIKREAVEGVTAKVAPQKVHYAEAEEEFLANPADPAREYTAKELKGMSNTEWRSLLFINGQSRGRARVAAVNRVLRGDKYTGQ
jgi:hypothetical protein